MIAPRILEPSQFDDCVPLLQTYQFKPYTHYSGKASDGAIRCLFVDKVRQSITDGGKAFCISNGSRPVGLAVWRRLEWDSNLLGYGAGRLDYLVAEGDDERQAVLKEALLRVTLHDCLRQGITHLSTRVSASDLASVRLLTHHGFILTDGILTFLLDLCDWQAPPNSPPGEIRGFRDEDVGEIKEIARKSYRQDRFHLDPSIPHELADHIYVSWMENACSGNGADEVIVGVKDGAIVSYVSCKLERLATRFLGFQVGTIVLVATAQEARGQRWAQATTFGALNWFKKNGVRFVEVGTQLSNIPAARLYETCGFKLASSSLSLRRLVQNV